MVATPTASPAPVPAERLHEDDFVSACARAPDSLIYFLLNVGDGDTQLILLPAENGGRQAIVVDIATTRKLPGLVSQCEGQRKVGKRQVDECCDRLEDEIVSTFGCRREDC